MYTRALCSVLLLAVSLFRPILPEIRGQDVDKPSKKIALKHRYEIHRIFVSPTGKQAITQSSDSIRLWDVENGKEIRLFEHSAVAGAAGFSVSKDWKRFEVSNLDEVSLFEIDSGQLVCRIERAEGPIEQTCISSSSVSTDGKKMAIGAVDQSVKIWRAGSAKPIAVLPKFDFPVSSISFCGNDSLIVVPAMKIVYWDLTANKCLHEFSPDPATVSPKVRGFECVSISEDNKWLAACCYQGGVNIWNIKDGQLRNSWPGLARKVAFSRNNKRFAFGDNTGKVQILDLETFATTQVIDTPRGDTFCLDLSPNGEVLFTAGHQDGSVRLWNLKKVK